MVTIVTLATQIAWSAGYGEIFTHNHDRSTTIRLPLDVPAWQWIGTFTLTERWRAHFIWRGGPGWFLPIAWSLGYEERFYLVAGLLMFLASRFWFELAAMVTVAVVATVIVVPIEEMRGF
jgi:peptidoglycan/LPS O-acetylase OafA/YrhL